MIMTARKLISGNPTTVYVLAPEPSSRTKIAADDAVFENSYRAGNSASHFAMGFELLVPPAVKEENREQGPSAERFLTFARQVYHPFPARRLVTACLMISARTGMCRRYL